MSIARHLKQPTRWYSVASRCADRDKRDHSHLFGLAPSGVYLANQVTLVAGELLPHRFTLTDKPKLIGGLLSVALALIATKVATGRRYRPPCSSEPGLSSRRNTITASDHSARSNLIPNLGVQIAKI